MKKQKLCSICDAPCVELISITSGGRHYCSVGCYCKRPTFRCPIHPYYTAAHYPLVDCPICNHMWSKKYGLSGKSGIFLDYNNLPFVPP